MARLGVPLRVTEKMLNHRSGSLGGVAEVYNRHAYIDEMKLAMKQHEAFVLSLIGQP